MFYIVDLSVVIPTYNSENTISPLIFELERLMEGLSYEVICVDDCSTDNVKNVLDLLKTTHPHLKCIYLYENMGQQLATLRGIAASNGSYVATLDDDFGQPPAYLLELYSKAVQENFDLVYGVPRAAPNMLFYRRIGSILRDLFFTVAITKNPKVKVSSFRVMSRALASRICNSYHSYVYISAIAFEEKIKACTLYYEPEQLPTKSGYRFLRLVKIYWNLLWEYGICKGK